MFLNCFPMICGTCTQNGVLRRYIKRNKEVSTCPGCGLLLR